MPDMAPTTDAPAEAASTETAQTTVDWEKRYSDLRSYTQKTSDDLTAALDALKAEHQAALDELGTFREKADALAAEEAERQTYESLREKFEEEPPKPIANAQASARVRDWTDGPENHVPYAQRDRVGQERGWPV